MVANICSKYFACKPPPRLTSGLGSKCQNETLLELAQVAYQIKGNHECSNMVSNLLLSDRPPQTTLKMGSICQNYIFSEHGHVTYQIKWNLKMQLHSSKYFAHRPPMPLSPSIGQKSTISEHGHVAYQI